MDQELKLDLATLQAMEVVNLTAEHPKKGPTEYQGVRLSELLLYARARSEATGLKLVAGDGYQYEVTLADIQNCPDCLVSFGEEGDLSMVMPGMPSAAWVKGVVTIEAK